MKNRTAYSYRWSATYNSTLNAYGLAAYINEIYPQYGIYRGNGFALRCGTHFRCIVARMSYNTGDDSFSHLLGTYGLPTTNEQNAPTEANQLANFPLNFLRTGRYIYSDGSIAYRKANGEWWSATNSEAPKANTSATNTGGVLPRYGNPRGFGFALGCGETNAGVFCVRLWK